ncbi:MAG: IS110 family transposase [Actinomycetota bacterium]
MGVAIGVDSHKSSLAVGALNEVGHLEEVREFTNDRRGHESVLTWIQQHGSERVVGIEGSGSYGAGLVRRLLEAGEDVRAYFLPSDGRACRASGLWIFSASSGRWPTPDSLAPATSTPP